MSESTIRPRDGVAAWLYARVRRWQRDLSDSVHAAGDERAHQQGWQITKSTGPFGFGTRTYRDPRFDDRHRGADTTRGSSRARTGGRDYD
jgi:hypothetical protein